MNVFLKKVLEESGRLLMKYHGKLENIKEKSNQSNIVTRADVESEKIIIKLIEKKFTNYNIVAEESGFVDKRSKYTWIIDPLDGTSNYASALPWFGSMIALLKDDQIIIAAAYLPYYKDYYFAKYRKGASKNGKKITVTKEIDMRHTLISYSLDYSNNFQQIIKDVKPIQGIVQNSRNLRSTNSILDACYVADGRLGGNVYKIAKIWDVAPASLLIKEAGGRATDINGKNFKFHINKKNIFKDYSFVSGNKIIHNKLIKIINNV